MIKKLILMGACIILLASCTSTKNMYSWYNYEDISYKYSKKSTDELQVKLLSEYQKIAGNQKGLRAVVPPGLYAEYGFLLCKTGKMDEGISFLKQEIKLYPESEKYISRIIKQLEQ